MGAKPAWGGAPPGIEIVYRILDPAIQVRGHTFALGQAVHELLLNSLDAMEERPGVISVECGVLYADEAYLAATCPMGHSLPVGRLAYLRVTDQGHGMDDDALREAFDPFFSTRLPGRGIDLASVFGTVQTHGGCLRLDSLVGEGTTVTILLPIHT